MLAARDDRENSRETVAGDGASGQPRTADNNVENANPRTGDEGFRGTPKKEGSGVLSAVWLMFSTPRNASFFTAVVLSGMGKGIIDTFRFVWSVAEGTHEEFLLAFLRYSESHRRAFFPVDALVVYAKYSRGSSSVAYLVLACRNHFD